MVNTSDKDTTVDLEFNGLKKRQTVKTCKVVRLTSEELYVDNSLEAPARIVPVECELPGEGREFTLEVPALSFNIFVLSRN